MAIHVIQLILWSVVAIVMGWIEVNMTPDLLIFRIYWFWMLLLDALLVISSLLSIVFIFTKDMYFLMGWGLVGALVTILLFDVGGLIFKPKK